MLQDLSQKINKLDSNVITNYALYILSGLIIYILMSYFSNLENEFFILLAFSSFTLK